MITFIGDKSRSSGQVRGVQISSVVGGNFFDIHSHSFIGEQQSHSWNRIAIFVRGFNQNIAKELKAKGHKVGFDIIDRPVANLHNAQKSDPDVTEIDWKILTNDLIDFYVVTNHKAKRRLLEALNDKKPIYVIPHHCAPSSLEKKNHTLPRTVGYVGLSDQLHNMKEIEKHVHSLGLNFFVGHPKDLNDCLKMLKKIDIGVIFLKRNNRTGYVLDYKPNQKLSNFQCLGIPVVSCDYESFKEFGKSAYLSATTLDDVKQHLSELCSNEKLRDGLIEKGYKAASSVLLKNVAFTYQKMVRELY